MSEDRADQYDPINDPMRPEYYQARRLPLPAFLLPPPPAQAPKAAPAPAPVPATSPAPPETRYGGDTPVPNYDYTLQGQTYGNPWDSVIPRIQAANPGASAGQVWQKYTTGQYDSQAGDQPNPYIPGKGYIAPTATGGIDWSQARPTQTRNTSGELDTDPYAVGIRDELSKQAAQQAKIIPGAPPNLAVLKDGTIVNIIDMRPVDPKSIDPVTRRFADLAMKAKEVPRVVDTDRLQSRISGRGYTFKNQGSAEEQDLERRFLAGDDRVATKLAAMRDSRIQEKKRGLVDQIMRPLTLAAIGTGASLATGGAAAPFVGSALGGAIGGAVGGGLTSTLASHGDPKTSLTGLGAGAAGGLVGGALPQGGGALGGGLRGAASGAAGAGANVGLTKALGGTVNPYDVLRSAIAGGVGGAVGGGTVGSDPEGIGNFNIPPSGMDRLEAMLFGQGVGRAVGSQLPQGRTGFSVDPNLPDLAGDIKSLQNKDMNDFRAAAQDYLAKYNAAMEERNAAIAAYNEGVQGAVDKRNSQVDAYNQQVTASRQRLRDQAAAYLDQFMQSRNAPLPMIPGVTSAPAPRSPAPKPDEFDPSSFLSNYSPEGFAISRGASNSEFPVTQSGQGTQTATAAPAKVTPKATLPLNILQLLAAARSQRRG